MTCFQATRCEHGTTRQDPDNQPLDRLVGKRLCQRATVSGRSNAVTFRSSWLAMCKRISAHAVPTASLGSCLKVDPKAAPVALFQAVLRLKSRTAEKINCNTLNDTKEGAIVGPITLLLLVSRVQPLRLFTQSFRFLSSVFEEQRGGVRYRSSRRRSVKVASFAVGA